MTGPSQSDIDTLSRQVQQLGAAIDAHNTAIARKARQKAQEARQQRESERRKWVTPRFDAGGKLINAAEIPVELARIGHEKPIRVYFEGLIAF